MFDEASYRCLTPLVILQCRADKESFRTHMAICRLPKDSTSWFCPVCRERFPPLTAQLHVGFCIHRTLGVGGAEDVL